MCDSQLPNWWEFVCHGAGLQQNWRGLQSRDAELRERELLYVLKFL